MYKSQNRVFRNIQVTGNSIDSCATGIYMATENDANPRATDFIIADNVFTDCGQSINLIDVQRGEVHHNMSLRDYTGGTAVASFKVSASNNVHFNFNKFYNPACHAFAITTLDTNITIKNNWIEGAGQAGIFVNSARYWEIENNTIYNCNTDTSTSDLYGSGIGINTASANPFNYNKIIDDRATKLHRYPIYCSGALSDTLDWDGNVGRGYSVALSNYSYRVTEQTYGQYNPKAGSTADTLNYRPINGTDKLMVIQIYGTDINVKWAAKIKSGRHRIVHDAASGSEIIFWKAYP